MDRMPKRWEVFKVLLHVDVWVYVLGGSLLLLLYLVLALAAEVWRYQFIRGLVR